METLVESYPYPILDEFVLHHELSQFQIELFLDYGVRIRKKHLLDNADEAEIKRWIREEPEVRLAKILPHISLTKLTQTGHQWTPIAKLLFEHGTEDTLKFVSDKNFNLNSSHDLKIRSDLVKEVCTHPNQIAQAWAKQENEKLEDEIVKLEKLEAESTKASKRSEDRFEW